MARDERFWHPTRSEWKWLCEVRDDLDPNNMLFTKEGNAMAIWASEKPTEDIARGKAIAEKREADKKERLRQEMARSEEEMEKSMLSRERHRQSLVKEFEKRPERSRVQSEKQGLKRKAFTADDPFVASVLNAVDKDQRAKNGNMIIHARRLSDLPKVALSDAEAIRERVDFYYQLCVTDGVRPNLPGLALAFGMTRAGLMNALADRRMTREAADEIGRGIAMMDEILSAMTLAGQVNPVAAIYFMNNWLGYKNASEVTTKTTVVESGVDQKALEQKYQSVVDIE